MTYLDLFQVRPVRIRQYDLGAQAYYKHESIDSHGLPDGDRHIADFRAGWQQAESSERTAEYRQLVQRDAVLLARGPEAKC